MRIFESTITPKINHEGTDIVSALSYVQEILLARAFNI